MHVDVMNHFAHSSVCVCVCVSVCVCVYVCKYSVPFFASKVYMTHHF